MGNTKYLIVNADDYARTAGVARGIRAAHLRGIVTSTTIMMNMPGVEAELERALKEAPKLGLGVHLVLTSGQPLLPLDSVSSITNGRNRLPSLAEFTAEIGSIDPDQAAAEWDAQIQKFISRTGRTPDHLDSHHHASYFTEKIFERMLMLARKYDCPIRTIREGAGAYGGVSEDLSNSMRGFYPRLERQFRPVIPDHFIASFFDQTATGEQLQIILEGLEPGTTELMCHPGYADPSLMEGSTYSQQRDRELAILTSDSVRERIQTLAIQLINFKDLSITRIG